MLAAVTVPVKVHALVPLCLLEAIQNLDTPVDDGLSELAGETVSKRLGLSQTVATQIERYRESADEDETVSDEEAVSVFRLVGRRPDATLVYSDAGRRAARYAARTTNLGVRAVIVASPAGVRRRLGVRAATRIARRMLGLELVLAQGVPETRLPESLATRAGFAGTGCHFYGAALGELLRLTSGFEGAMAHDRCRARGDDHCLWRASEPEAYE